MEQAYPYLDRPLTHRMQAALARRLFLSREEDSYHNPYDQEVREVRAIESGDPEALERSIEEVYKGSVGTLSRNTLRNAKNIGIVVLTSASRAAIRGGLAPETAFSLSDLYIEELEACTQIDRIYRIVRSAEFHYTLLVKETQAQKETAWESEPVTAAKNYIFRHLHQTLTVREVAEALELNPNYLSGLFRRQCQETMKSYILRSKIRLVRNLLTYSSYTYSEISDYLGFANQSHLAAVFRRETHMTMSQYRKAYQMQDFLD